jgi:hypothetical protein
MSWGKVSLGNLSGSLVGLERCIGRGLATVANSKLSQITVIITFPENKENIAISLLLLVVFPQNWAGNENTKLEK